MDELTLERAYGLALNQAQVKSEHPLCVLPEFTQIHLWGWAVLVNSKEYAETRDVSDMLVGTGLLLVVKSTGEVFETGSAYGSEYYIRNFEMTGNPYAVLTRQIEIQEIRPDCNLSGLAKFIAARSDLGVGEAFRKAKELQLGQETLLQLESVSDLEAENDVRVLRELGVIGRRLVEETD